MESTDSIFIERLSALKIGEEQPGGDRQIIYKDTEFLLEGGKAVILEEMKKVNSFHLVFLKDSTPYRIIGITC